MSIPTEINDVAAPLSSLTQDEQLMRETVRRFAQREIAPLVREMDSAQKLAPESPSPAFCSGIDGD